jgi:hypothetical protein
MASRYFILRDDFARTKEAPFFQKILDKINTRQWSYRKDFKKKGRRFGKKVYNDREQNLDDVSEHAFFKKFNEKERMYFYEHLVRWKNSKQPLKVYRFAERWRFVLKVQVNMITKVRVKNLHLEKQKAEVEKFFTYERRLRILKIRHGSNKWKWDYFPKDKYKNLLHNRTFASILDEHWPDQQMKVSFKNPRQTRGFCFLPDELLSYFWVTHFYEENQPIINHFHFSFALCLLPKFREFKETS